MRALQVLERGQPPQLRKIEMPGPEKGQVRLRIAACGLNFADLLMITGQYQERPPLPFTLGLEATGTVDTLGQDVRGLSIGDRVAVFGGGGGLAEYGCFDARNCIRLPDGMPFQEGAAFQVAYGTSHVALDHKAKLRPDETLLVLGAAGGVGLAAVEIGKRMGAVVIACARGADRLAVAKAAGADHLIDSEDEDIKERVKSFGGADVVYDPVGGHQFTAALRACNRDARIVVIGFASGTVPPIPANIILVKNISVLGMYWGGYLAFKPQVVTDSLKALLAWYDQGRLTPRISHVLPLERASDALELLRSRQSTGKVVVTMSG
ncbi:MAG: NADPH:quinone oxidoreductase family protein [Pseudomonadota bacterium]